MIKFEWDPLKNEANKQKHKLSFEEAETVFFDENAVMFSDPDHSETEERFLMIGLTNFGRICTVVHCFKHENQVIRIISARKAVRKEIDAYYKLMGRWKNYA